MTKNELINKARKFLFEWELNQKPHKKLINRKNGYDQDFKTVEKYAGYFKKQGLLKSSTTADSVSYNRSNSKL